MVTRSLGTVALVVLAAAAAPPTAAQEPVAPPAAGSLVVEETRSGFVVAPDYRFTRVDGQSAGLLGVRAGLLTDRRLFIGGAAYGLPGNRDGLKMLYGGGLVEWFANPGGFVDFSVSGLVGAGSATVTPGSILSGYSRLTLDGGRDQFSYQELWTRHRGWWTGHHKFFVAEPQATVHLNLTDWLRVGGGAGYRFAGAAGDANGRLSGFAGSIGVQIGPR